MPGAPSANRQPAATTLRAADKASMHVFVTDQRPDKTRHRYGTSTEPVEQLLYWSVELQRLRASAVVEFMQLAPLMTVFVKVVEAKGS